MRSCKHGSPRSESDKDESDTENLGDGNRQDEVPPVKLKRSSSVWKMLNKSSNIVGI